MNVFSPAALHTNPVRGHDLAQLIHTYQVNGPRYTSYPTAPEFTSTFGSSDYAEEALASNEKPLPKPLSLYVHVPFCKSLCYYCGCNKVVTHTPSKVEAYLEHLYKEIELQSSLYAKDRFVEQIHLGGGTPTYLKPSLLKELIETLGHSFHFGLPSKMQMAIELDPRGVSVSDAEQLAGIGFNRMSIGVQDTHPQVQRAVNREQDLMNIKEIIRALRSKGVPSISVDLIYGLPHQTRRSFAKTLELVHEHLAPDTIALYNYAHMPERIAAQRLIHSSTLPSAEEKTRIFLDAVDRLAQAGYRYLGMDHFAKPHDPLCKALDHGTLQRNFQGYSTHAGCDLIGMGVSAISHVGNSYAQNTGILGYYRELVDKGELAVHRGFRMNSDDQIRAELIQQIMCEGEVNWSEINALFGICSESYFMQERESLMRFCDDGLIHMNRKGFRVTELGRFFLRPIAMVFDAYLPALRREEGVFSSSQARYSKVF